MAEDVNPEGPPIAKLSWERRMGSLAAAALINATLITTCMIALIILSIVLKNIPCSRLPLDDLPLFACGVAPLMYRIIWQLCRFNKSPGEQWLAINSANEQFFRQVFTDCVVGVAAYWIAVAISGLSECVAHNYSNEHDIYYAKLYGFLAQAAVSLFTYTFSLGLLLFLKYWRSTLPDFSIKQTASLGCTLGVLAWPIFACFSMYSLTPVYSAPLVRNLECWLVLTLLAIWWVAGLVIVRYWNCLQAIGFYVYFFASSGILYFGLVPALLVCIQIRGPGEI